MPTINQLMRKGARVRKAVKAKKLALKLNWNSLKKKYSVSRKPFIRGTIDRVFVNKPSKPNSANRACAKVTLINKKEVTVYIPGEEHTLQQYSSVLICGGGAQDVPGSKYSIVRGFADAKGVAKRKQGRSLYGTKKGK